MPTEGRAQMFLTYGVKGDLTGITDADGNTTLQRYDPLVGMYSFPLRSYNPGAGRWATQDPIHAGLNWYAYVDNDPTDFVDPLGLNPSDLANAGNGYAATPNPYGNGYEIPIGNNEAIYTPQQSFLQNLLSGPQSYIVNTQTGAIKSTIVYQGGTLPLLPGPPETLLLRYTPVLTKINQAERVVTVAKNAATDAYVAVENGKVTGPIARLAEGFVEGFAGGEGYEPKGILGTVGYAIGELVSPR